MTEPKGTTTPTVPATPPPASTPPASTPPASTPPAPTNPQPKVEKVRFKTVGSGTVTMGAYKFNNTEWTEITDPQLIKRARRFDRLVEDTE